MCLGLGCEALSLGGGGDVAVGDDGAGHGLYGLGDRDVIDFGPIESFDGAAVHGEEVDLMLGEDCEDFLEALLSVEADSHFNREEARDLLAHRPDQFVDFRRIAEQAAADVLAVHFRCGATHVEVDARHGELTQFADGAQHVRRVLAD